MDISFVIEKFVLVVIIFAISLVIAMYSTYAERKVAVRETTTIIRKNRYVAFMVCI